MKPLPPPDLHYVSAAAGWLELGCPAEAAKELGQVSPALQKEAPVLQIWWEIFAAQKEWEDALRTARALLQAAPTQPGSYILEAYALRRVPSGGIEQARAILLSALPLFPEEDTIAFNLACYATQLGQLDEGWDWFQRAIKIVGNLKLVKARALADDDLKPLWPRIAKL
jgi:tetratricopeptide (TPR) repeat protein